MSTVMEIEAAIEQLPPQDQQRLREWLLKRETSQPSVWEKLRSLAGTAKNLPPDMAANHDHYLHGLPKRVP
jgi:tellurite resistance-related uncharacterized protein